MSAEGTTILEVRDLHVAYGRVEVVHGAALEVRGGAVTCLIGANGAGKSTTLRALSGLHRASSGTVTFSGNEIQKLEAHRVARHGIALVPEGRHVFASLSVIDNLRMGGVPRRASWRSPDGLDEVFELFPELVAHRDREAGLLSGGQQQMLAVGRALMAKPRLLVLDEPSMGLAPLLVDRIYDALFALKERGTTILIAEQNARLALRLADHAYVLETGNVVEGGPAADLRHSPRVEEIYLGG
jgi:branched-chain amino acid transport system ATP-binding protein